MHRRTVTGHRSPVTREPELVKKCIISGRSQKWVRFVAKHMRIIVKPFCAQASSPTLLKVTHLSGCDRGRFPNPLIEEYFLAGEAQSFYE